MTITVQEFLSEIRNTLASRGITNEIHMGEFDSLTVGVVTQNGKLHVVVRERETMKPIKGTVNAN